MFYNQVTKSFSIR